MFAFLLLYAIFSPFWLFNIDHIYQFINGTIVDEAVIDRGAVVSNNLLAAKEGSERLLTELWVRAGKIVLISGLLVRSL